MDALRVPSQQRIDPQPDGAMVLGLGRTVTGHQGGDFMARLNERWGQELELPGKILMNKQEFHLLIPRYTLTSR